MDANQKKLIQLRTKLEFYKKLDKKIDKVLKDELSLDDWSDEVFDKINKLEDELSTLKVEMDIPDHEWYSDKFK